MVSRTRLARHRRLFTSEHDRQLAIRTIAPDLRGSGLARATREHYTVAYNQWIRYCHSLPPHRHHRPGHPAAAAEFDECMMGYLALLYRRDDGRGRSQANYVLYGTYHLYPVLTGQLQMSQQLLDGWERRHPSVHHPPLTWPLTVLIAIAMAEQGYTQEALATLVAFDGLLRVGELIALRRQDVAFPADHRRGAPQSGLHSLTLPSHSSASSSASSSPSPNARVLLRLALTKTGQDQWAELHNEELSNLLRLHLQYNVRHRRTEPLFTVTHGARLHTDAKHVYSRTFKAVCASLGLSEAGFTPHSLRHGGATFDLLHRGMTVETVLVRGRWQSNSSMRTYLQAGRAMLLESSVPRQVMREAQRVEGTWALRLQARLFPDLPPDAVRE